MRAAADGGDAGPGPGRQRDIGLLVKGPSPATFDGSPSHLSPVVLTGTSSVRICG